MKYFTADWHINEISAPNTHTFLRPKDFNLGLPSNLVWPEFQPEDEFYFLGDMAIDLAGLEFGCKWIAENVPCKKIFVLGDKETANKNFTLQEAKNIIYEYFDDWSTDDSVVIDGSRVALVHKPIDMKDVSEFSGIVGHIHGVARVLKTKSNNALVNVGIDAWCFQIVPETWIQHQITAVTKGYYDENCFITF